MAPRPHIVFAFLLGLTFVFPLGAFECAPLELRSAPVSPGEFTRGLLWRIESAHGNVNYLFGTVHISDPRVTNLPAPVRSALADSTAFGMEVMLDADTMQQMFAAMYYDGAQTLQGVLEPALYRRTTTLLERYGLNEAVSARLRPWAAYTTLALPPGPNEAPLDMVLLQAAEAAGQDTFGLETMEEQLAVFDALDTAEQIELLTLTVCHYELFQRELTELIDAYVARDLAALVRMASRYESELQDRFMKVLLDERNRRMLQRMRPRLDRGGAFIAVGALHLPGPDGLLRLLRDAGYTVTAVY